MTTKDYVYLGLILLTALAFYCNGFYAGVYRCKRMYESIVEESEAETPSVFANQQDGNILATKENQFSSRTGSRTECVFVPSREFPDDFGRN
jgi:hypothetical protein